MSRSAGKGQPGEIESGTGQNGGVSAIGGAGGFNGGAKGGDDPVCSTDECVSGGGGASDVHTISRDDTDPIASLESRLIVAAGGGDGADRAGISGSGGGAGMNGTSYALPGAAGRAGTLLAGGAGGTGIHPGAAGVFGLVGPAALMYSTLPVNVVAMKLRPA
jgi:hypothetical protein